MQMQHPSSSQQSPEEIVSIPLARRIILDSTTPLPDIGSISDPQPQSEDDPSRHLFLSLYSSSSSYPSLNDTPPLPSLGVLASFRSSPSSTGATQGSSSGSGDFYTVQKPKPEVPVVGGGGIESTNTTQSTSTAANMADDQQREWIRRQQSQQQYASQSSSSSSSSNPSHSNRRPSLRQPHLPHQSSQQSSNPPSSYTPIQLQLPVPQPQYYTSPPLPGTSASPSHTPAFYPLPYGQHAAYPGSYTMPPPYGPHPGQYQYAVSPTHQSPSPVHGNPYMHYQPYPLAPHPSSSQGADPAQMQPQLYTSSNYPHSSPSILQGPPGGYAAGGTWYYTTPTPPSASVSGNAGGGPVPYQGPYGMGFAQLGGPYGPPTQPQVQQHPTGTSASPALPTSASEAPSSEPAYSPALPHPSLPPFSSQSPQQPPPPPRRRDHSPDPHGAGPSPHPQTRKPYHPNPPPQRSEWVMWVGNVPSDATQDELLAFFSQPVLNLSSSTASPTTSTQPPTTSTQPTASTSAQGGNGQQGVLSVHLISRSNCAFVNFSTQSLLASAVSYFNGRPLRPKDPKCPRLVCRVRRKDDDLKAGVGGQRGIGLHARWIHEQRARERERGERDEGKEEDPPTSPSTHLAPSSSSGDPSPPSIPARTSDEEGPLGLKLTGAAGGSLGGVGGGEPRTGSSGEHSFASTTSSLLSKHFPKRYFILKSLTEDDLSLSVEEGVWATQVHNEPILDKAFRTSQDVFLIFGANKSGEFFGYARMAGPILGSDFPSSGKEKSVSWASRPSHLPELSIPEEGENATPDQTQQSPKSERERDRPPVAGPSKSLGTLFSPGEKRFVQASPSPLTGYSAQASPFPRPSIRDKPAHVSAPPEMDAPHKRVSKASAEPPLSETVPTDFEFQLDPEAPRRAMVDREASSSRDQSHDPQPQPNPKSEAGTMPEGWGKPFKVDWIKVEKLPFYRTRHLRNPWNNGREVKVSRDGTEIEPSVGDRLLEEWERVGPDGLVRTVSEPEGE